MAITTNFVYSKGETWILNVDLRNSNNQPLDLTGGYAELAVCPQGNTLQLLYINTAACSPQNFQWSNQQAGQGTFYVFGNLQANLVANTVYRYQIESVTANNIVGLQCNGIITISTNLFHA